MTSKRKETVPIGVNYATDVVRSWYLDIYNQRREKLHRVHVFISSLETPEIFDDF